MQKYKIMGAGTSPLAAAVIGGTSAAGLTATGSTSQANSYAITEDVNEFTTTAANTGARLPLLLAPGDSIWISNFGAQTLFVYPGTGESINAEAANAKVDVATGKNALFVKVGATRWAMILTA